MRKFGFSTLDLLTVGLATSLMISCSDSGSAQQSDAGGSEVGVGFGADAAEQPDSDGDGLPDATEAGLGTNPNKADSDGDGYSDGEEVRFGSNPLLSDSTPEGCTDIAGQAEQARRPVDIVVVVDQSSSMRQEIWGIEDFINTSFHSRISDLDYRVVLIALYGNSAAKTNKNVHRTWDDKLEDFYAICIAPPLGGNACALPSGCDPTAEDDPQCVDADGDGVIDLAEDRPKNTARFWHYDQAVDSRDALQVLRHTYDRTDRHGAVPGGWGALLRPGSLKFLIVFSDDNSRVGAASFESWLFERPDHFGRQDARSYVLHSIVGVAAKQSAPDAPYTSAEALVEGECGSAQNAGEQHQQLAVNSGGLRFPVCNDGYSSEGDVSTTIYQKMFDTLGETVVSASKVPCSYSLPPPPEDLEYDFDGVLIKYTPAPGAAVQDIAVVDDAAACGSGPGYYVTGDSLQLCPATCSSVQASQAAELKIHISCRSGYGLH